METVERAGRAGWREEETERLLCEVERACAQGEPLRAVFEKMGDALGRKPNSVRNYYYMRVRAGDFRGVRRAAPFEVFTEDEVRALVSQVLRARAAGESVRACVTRLSGGDRALMLRYQNKYRSVLKKRPELIAELAAREGVAPPSIPGARQDTLLTAARDKARMLRDPEVRVILAALEALAERAQAGDDVAANDRMRVERDLLMLRAEDLQRAAHELTLACKELVALPEAERFLRLNALCETLARRVSAVENAFL